MPKYGVLGREYGIQWTECSLCYMVHGKHLALEVLQCLTMEVLGPKYDTCNAFWDLIPSSFGTWTQRTGARVYLTHACIHTCMHTCTKKKNMHRCVRTYVRTCEQLHTCVHAYMYTGICILSLSIPICISISMLMSMYLSLAVSTCICTYTAKGGLPSFRKRPIFLSG